MAKKRTATYLDELMAEPMRLPGAPDLIVTRDWAYAWLKTLGYPLHGGFNSVDYMVFGRDVATAKRTEVLELTDLTQPWVIALITRMEADLTRQACAVAVRAHLKRASQNSQKGGRLERKPGTARFL
jgi:hypothetical protein